MILSKHRISLWSLLAALCIAPCALAQERKLEPVDEAAKDPSWVSFKNRLLNAVAKRDHKFVASILHQSVRVGLSGGRGVAQFRKEWELDSNASPLWQELPSALYLGAAWNKPEKGQSELCSPYVAVRWPQDLDAFAGGAIIGRDVLLKSAPSGDSGTIAALSYHTVEVVDWEVNDQAAASKQKWVKIRVSAGEGYVPEEQIRSPIEHAACFVKTEGGWRLIGFGPGGGK
jgi:hypothetical protein